MKIPGDSRVSWLSCIFLLLFDMLCHYTESSQRTTTVLHPHPLSAKANCIVDDVRPKAFSARRPDIPPPSLPSQISFRRSRLKSKLCAKRPFGCQRSIPPLAPPSLAGQGGGAINYRLEPLDKAASFRKWQLASLSFRGRKSSLSTSNLGEKKKKTQM